MALFVLTWNPTKSLDEDVRFVRRAVSRTASGWSIRSRWSVGPRKGGIEPGDRTVMLRQERERGIVASGEFTSGVTTGPHWLDPKRTAQYASIEWEIWVPAEDRLPTEILKSDFPQVNWDYGFQASGNRIGVAAARAVEARWRDHLLHLGLDIEGHPDESTQSFREGDRTTVKVNRYERDPRARASCLAANGYRCAACDIDFEEAYGSLGRGFIHVHHVRGLAGSGEDHAVDPVVDLVPLCPNCHAMVHRGCSQARSIPDLRKVLARARRGAGST